jgi:aspartyl-tRNA(Asn)/glutamyl-tRNA(Gln) amidotransferase subunit A
MKHDDIAWLGVDELTQAYRRRELSPVDVASATLERIESLNPQLNAFCLVDADSALRDARASEARWMRDEALGPLDGVPASIKDLILTRGWPTLRGSLSVDPAGPWDTDAPATARLREAGAVLLGKTTTPEYGWRGSTDSRVYGITRNPWRLDTTPGGSSGGATAAVAAGLGPLALGTDGGGSVRIPAAFTATVGLKAHFGRVPAWPMSPMGTVSHVGPQTRTVADCARLLEVIAKPDSRDWTALPAQPHDWSADVARGRRPDGIRGLRIAFSPRLGHVKWIDPRIERALDAAAKTFSDLGAIVESADPGFEDSADVFRVHWFTSARHLLHRLPAEKQALLDPGLREVVDYAARYTIADYLDAQLRRGQMAAAMARFAQRFDLLLTPATAVLPFAVGRVMPQPPDGLQVGMIQDWTWWTPFSYPFNLTQQPAIVLPCGFSDDGLPIGLQLVAPAHREDLCLLAGAAYEAATDWHRVRPPIAA